MFNQSQIRGGLISLFTFSVARRSLLSAMSTQAFIHDDFLLQSDFARELYHRYAASEPIYDYHCHLPPDEIATNRRFTDLYDIWLRGDHYKWRAMRTNGIAERFCTGNASPKEKFLAWAETMPHTLRNPLYHWSHLELKRHFGIDTLLSPKTAEDIWHRANARLQEPDFCVHGILKKFRVSVICTTDDPADDLAHHQSISKSGLATRVYPTFRPDKALTVDAPEVFNGWCDRLAAVCQSDIRSLSALLDALKKRHDFFHALGCRLSDHGLEHAYAEDCTDAQAAAIFDKARSGKPATHEEKLRFASYIMLFSGRLDAARGWTKQLHLGPRRNNNTRLFRSLGPDTGFDSIGDSPQVAALSRYLDKLDQENALPRTVIYNINPADNYAFATLIGNFQDGTIPGKIQWGSGWWFLDQKEGMQWQLNALSQLGLLSRFVGMLTDSRSFLSFTRHEYFRRILCDLIARDVEAGELPSDIELLGDLVRRISYENASKYFGLQTGSV